MSILSFIDRILGAPHESDLKRIRKIIPKIHEWEKEFQVLEAADLPKKTKEFKERVTQGESLDALLPEAFALVKRACEILKGTSYEVRGHMQTWDMVPYDVQLIGGIVIHEGKISEMKTGEGKTLVCTLPVYLNALSDKGVHLVTVNEYLAERDADWMGLLYGALGLTVGVVKHGQSPLEKKAAYACDITYGTNNEFGFDYLRDNMAPSLAQQAQRPLNFAIVDEVDSILIDEARTPLIISAPAQESTEKYLNYSRLVQGLKQGEDYDIDEKQKVATLTEAGIQKMEALLKVDNIYTERGFEEVHHIEQALRAQAVYKRDVDYVVKDNKILIVDEFTGRLMDGRRYGQGLHQAIEAKEGVEIQRESKTLATITFQNYFRLYKKLAGMTGTAVTEREEFETIYGLSVIPIPTHRPVTRDDKSDLIYKNVAGKFQAIAQKVQDLHEKGQPVLIGTISVEKSEALSDALKNVGIPHHVLNAKQHEREAEIVALAGQKGAVTIATNMAGRGTDIKLGAGVSELGGLYVIGSERHESRRIDNQLRGRSGRQGDPGTTQFYVSMEDDLMRIFGGSRMQNMMERLGVPDDMPIENSWISKSLEGAQKRVEGHNFDIRKHLVQYDDITNTHRDIIYRRRQEILANENLKNDMIVMIETIAEKLVLTHTGETRELWERVMAIHKDSTAPIALETLEPLDTEGRIASIKNYLREEYLEKEKALPDPRMMRAGERMVALRVLDTLWMNHLTELKELRDAVALSGYGQRDPLVEFKNHAFRIFEELIERMEESTVQGLFRVKIQINPAPTLPVNTTASVTKVPTETELKEAGRNDVCPCGSGKKFKKCHGA